MRTLASVAVGLGLGLSLGMGAAAQTPPANATDISSLPAPAPTAEVAAPAGVVRIYIDSLTGADAAALQGLLTQALFESKKVVITENQANASLTLKGRVLRQLPPAAALPRKASAHRKARSATTAPPDMPAQVTDLDQLDAGVSQAALPIALDLNPTTDLSKYQYRLDLRLVDPQGDLVWMSGQGDQAPSFTPAQGAVQATVTPLLAALSALKP